tara:strand:- start:719 stop:1114 length:396 start_codon:yes stop_codon:yes gene_type:complete
MKKFPALTLTLTLTISGVAPTASAYNGYISDVRFGEHPYEQRKRDENRRKRLKKQFEKHGYYTFENPAYFHPSYAKRSVLHPHYRFGGTSQYIDGRFARWRGYQGSTSTHCSNYTFMRLPYRGSPVGQQCF